MPPGGWTRRKKRYTQIGRAPESKNVNPNRFAKSTSVLRGRYPQPCLCRPPVMKPTLVVLRKGGYWTVPLLGGKPAGFPPEPLNLLRLGFGAGSRANLRGAERHCAARNPAAGKPGEPGWRPLTWPGSRTGHDARDEGQVYPAALQLVGMTSAGNLLTAWAGTRYKSTCRRPGRRP